MSAEISVIPGGTITSPKGFSAGATFAGLKSPGEGKRDLGLLVSDRPCAAAATFTSSSVVSPTVTLNRQTLAGGGAFRGIMANSGCANACVGEAGLKDAREMVSLAASHLGVDPGGVFVCSTGVIGVEMPMGIVRQHLSEIKPSDDGGGEFARAIMTTDTHPKEHALTVPVDGQAVTIGGVSKGAGMIHPNMATMLAFIATDAAVDPDFLRVTLKEAVDGTFNQIDVDGDTSTNDTVLVLANGAAGNTRLSGGDDGSRAFAAGLHAVCLELAMMIARDGEGAQTLIEVSVEGARTLQDARAASRSVASSLLVKTAVHGRDPNWGRILMAVGKTGIELDESRIQLFINDIQIVEGGISIPYYTSSVVAALGEPKVYLRVVLNLGDASAKAWGCDLTEEYVVFNSAYTT